MTQTPPRSNRNRYQRRRATPPRSNNSVRRAYDLLRSTLANLEPDTVLVEHELVERLSASRNTVRIVLQLLAAEGLVCRGPKVGTHVGSSLVIPLDELTPTAELRASAAMHGQMLETAVIPAPDLVAERLQLEPGSQVRVTESLTVHGATAVGLVVSYVGLTSDSQVDVRDSLADTITFLEKHLAIPVCRSDTMVVALPCDAQTADLLDIPEGSPILFVEDLLRDDDDRPRALSQFRFRSDRVTLSMRAWRSGDAAPAYEPQVSAAEIGPA